MQKHLSEFVGKAAYLSEKDLGLRTLSLKTQKPNCSILAVEADCILIKWDATNVQVLMPYSAFGSISLP